MSDSSAPAPPPGFWGRVARVLAVVAPLVGWLAALVNISQLGITGGGVLDPPPLHWLVILVGAGSAVGMAYLIRRMLREDPGVRDLLGVLGLAALPWLLGLVGTLVNETRTLGDVGSTGFAGYAAMVGHQAQGAYLSWSLFGSALLALTVATFIRRVRPVPAEDGLPVAGAVIPAFILAIIGGNRADLGIFTVALIGVPLSGLFYLWFVGAATREKPSQSTVIPGIGAAFAFLLVLTAALSNAYSMGIGRMLFALYSTAGAGVEALQAGLAELASVRWLTTWGIVVGALPLGVIALQLRRRDRIVKPALLAATPVLLVGWGLHMLVTSRTQEMLGRLAVTRPAEPPPVPESATPTSVDSQPRVPGEPPPGPANAADFTGPGVVGGVPGGVEGAPAIGDQEVRIFFAHQVDEPARPVSQPQPNYPVILRQAGVAGSVEAQFVVDTVGRVESSSWKVLRSTHPLFESAAREAVLRSQFSPARIQGRAVRQVMQQRFGFALAP